MSGSVDIDFTFKSSVDISVVLRALLDAGMRPVVEGVVAYLIDEDGMFDWQRVEPGLVGEVLSKLMDPRWSDRVVGITLLFPTEDSGGDFLFHPGRTTVSCVIGVNSKILPGSSRFCDIGWYLTRLVPVFESIGLSEIEARDSL